MHLVLSGLVNHIVLNTMNMDHCRVINDAAFDLAVSAPRSREPIYMVSGLITEELNDDTN